MQDKGVVVLLCTKTCRTCEVSLPIRMEYPKIEVLLFE